MKYILCYIISYYYVLFSKYLTILYISILFQNSHVKIQFCMIMSVEPGRNWKKPTYDNQQKTPWNLSTKNGIIQTYSIFCIQAIIEFCFVICLLVYKFYEYTVIYFVFFVTKFILKFYYYFYFPNSPKFCPN